MTTLNLVQMFCLRKKLVTFKLSKSLQNSSSPFFKYPLSPSFFSSLAFSPYFYCCCCYYNYPGSVMRQLLRSGHKKQQKKKVLILACLGEYGREHFFVIFLKGPEDKMEVMVISRCKSCLYLQLRIKKRSTDPCNKIDRQLGSTKEFPAFEINRVELTCSYVHMVYTNTDSLKKALKIFTKYLCLQ